MNNETFKLGDVREIEDITILHLSDFHIDCKDDEHVKRDEILEKLKEKIVFIFSNEPDWIPDFIILTGDIAYAAKKEDYEKAVDLLSPIFSELKNKFGIDSSRIIVAAGNHDKDLYRNEYKDAPLNHKDIMDYIKNKKLSLDKHKKYLGFLDEKMKIEDNYNNLVGNYFSEFSTSFCKELGVSEPKKLSDKLIPGSSGTHTYGIHEFKDVPNVSFYCINSAICSLSGFVDYGRLTLQSTSIDGARKYFTKKIEDNKNHIVLTLMHHPASWLQEQSYYSFPNQIAVFSEITEFSSIIFCGHTHNNMRGKPDILRNTPIVMSGAIYKKSKKGMKDYWKSFNLVKINIEESTFTVRSYEHNKKEGDKENPWKLDIENEIFPLIYENHLELMNEKNELIEKNKLLRQEREFLIAQHYSKKNRMKTG